MQFSYEVYVLEALDNAVITTIIVTRSIDCNTKIAVMYTYWRLLLIL